MAGKSNKSNRSRARKDGEDIFLDIAGKSLRLRRTPTANGKGHYFALRQEGKGYSPYGLRIPALANDLPEYVECMGVRCELAVVEYDGNGKPFANGDKRRGETRITVDGEERRLLVTVRKVGADGESWNLVARAIRPGGGGDREPIDLSELS